MRSIGCSHTPLRANPKTPPPLLPPPSPSYGVSAGCDFVRGEGPSSLLRFDNVTWLRAVCLPANVPSSGGGGNTGGVSLASQAAPAGGSGGPGVVPAPDIVFNGSAYGNVLRADDVTVAVAPGAADLGADAAGGGGASGANGGGLGHREGGFFTWRLTNVTRACARTIDAACLEASSVSACYDDALRAAAAARAGASGGGGAGARTAAIAGGVAVAVALALCAVALALLLLHRRRRRQRRRQQEGQEGLLDGKSRHGGIGSGGDGGGGGGGSASGGSAGAGLQHHSGESALNGGRPWHAPLTAPGAAAGVDVGDSWRLIARSTAPGLWGAAESGGGGGGAADDDGEGARDDQVHLGEG